MSSDVNDRGALDFGIDEDLDSFVDELPKRKEEPSLTKDQLQELNEKTGFNGKTASKRKEKKEVRSEQPSVRIFSEDDVFSGVKDTVMHLRMTKPFKELLRHISVDMTTKKGEIVSMTKVIENAVFDLYQKNDL